MDMTHCPCSGINLPRLVQPVVLALLAEEPLHGYLLIRQLAETGLFSAASPDTTGVYRLLRNMEREELLCSSWDRDCIPARKIYAITEKGRYCLERWVCSLRSHQRFLSDVLLFLQQSVRSLAQRELEPLVGACPVAPRGV